MTGGTGFGSRCASGENIAAEALHGPEIA